VFRVGGVTKDGSRSGTKKIIREWKKIDSRLGAGPWGNQARNARRDKVETFFRSVGGQGRGSPLKVRKVAKWERLEQKVRNNRGAGGMHLCEGEKNR